MALARGQVDHGSYLYEGPLPGQGCLGYYFLFEDSQGTQHRYPSEGSLQVGVGEACEGLVKAGQAPPACTTEPVPDMGPGEQDQGGDDTGVPSEDLGRDMPGVGEDVGPGPDKDVGAEDVTLDEPNGFVGGSLSGDGEQASCQSVAVNQGVGAWLFRYYRAWLWHRKP